MVYKKPRLKKREIVTMREFIDTVIKWSGENLWGKVQLRYIEKKPET